MARQDPTSAPVSSGKPDDLRRIARLVQFARSSALDAGEYGICAQLTAIERQLEETLALRLAYGDKAPQVPLEAMQMAAQRKAR